jgi:hypothetical protein
VCGILALVAACARSGGMSGELPLTGHGAVVEIRNDEFDDVIVYLIRGGTPIPLGVVPGLNHRSFGLGQAQLGDGGGVELGAGRRGGPIQRVTAPFDLAPGRIATWIVRAGDRVEQPVVR